MKKKTNPMEEKKEDFFFFEKSNTRKKEEIKETIRFFLFLNFFEYFLFCVLYIE